MPFYPDYEPEQGDVEIAGKSFEISRVVAQKKQFVEIDGKFVMAEFWEVLDEGSNMGFLHIDDKWIEGRTHQRRWKGEGGRPERQNVFTSYDGTFSFVVTSERITL